MLSKVLSNIGSEYVDMSQFKKHVILSLKISILWIIYKMFSNNWSFI